MASAGKILIMPKGNYNESTTYEMLDLVNHNGTSWIAKKTVTGIAPVEGEYWQNVLGLNIVNNLDATEEGGVLDATMGKILKDMLDRVALMKDYSLMDGFYGRKIGRQVTLYLEGHTVTTNVYGNGGDVGVALKPVFDITFPLFVEGEGLCVGLIDKNSIFTVYSADMGRYVSGKVQGTVSYMTSETNL